MTRPSEEGKSPARDEPWLPHHPETDGEATAWTYLVQYVAFNDFKPSLSTYSSPYCIYIISPKVLL